MFLKHALAIVAVTFVSAAPTELHGELGPDEPHWTQRRGLQDHERDCPPTLHRANETFWMNYLPDSEYDLLNRGWLDITELYEKVAEMGTAFEDHISKNLGSFDRTDSSNILDVGLSYISKLNAVTAPVLLSPFAVKRTDANAEKWDQWWDALQGLYPTSHDNYRGYCNPYATSKDWKPTKLTFPGYMSYDDFLMNEAYVPRSPLRFIDPVAWLAYTSQLQTAPKSEIIVHDVANCSTHDFDYSEEISETTESSSEHTIESSVEASVSLEVSASAEGSFLGIGGSASTTITTSVGYTSGKSATEGHSESRSKTIATNYSTSHTLHKHSTTNITMFTEQYEADVIFPADGKYHDTLSGVQIHIDGHRRWPVGNDESPIIPLIDKGDLQTPEHIREVVKLAMDVIGAKWSPVFIETLTTVSVEGKAKSVAGDNVHVEIHECQTDKVDYNTCSPSDSHKYPPADLSCSIMSRRTTDDSSNVPAPDDLNNELHTNPSKPTLNNVPDDCYDVLPVENQPNTWYFKMLSEECKALVQTTLLESYHTH
eukprot:Clim_evm3s206 gene=Clim_evmTU3s206